MVRTVLVLYKKQNGGGLVSCGGGELQYSGTAIFLSSEK